MKKIFLAFTIYHLIFSFSFRAHAYTYEFTDDNQIDLLHNSREAAKLKLDLIRKAKSSIHIMSYFLDNSQFAQDVFEELKKANQRGVEIRILSTYLPTLAKDLTLKTVRNLKNKKKDTVFSYLLLHPQENLTILNNLHEKIFLVDGQTAIIGGRNLSDTSFKAKDIEAIVSGSMTSQIQDHFLKVYNMVLKIEVKRQCPNLKWGMNCSHLLERTKFSREDKKYFPIPEVTGTSKARLISHTAVLDQIEKDMNHDERIQLEDDIINAVVSSEFQSMRAYNYFIIPTHKYYHFLKEQMSLNKDVKLITNSLKTAGIVSDKGYIKSLPVLSDLVSSGLDVYQWQGPTDLDYLHEKVIIFNEDHVFLGSHNFGIGSTAASNEIAIEFYSKDLGAELVNIFDEEIANLDKTKKATTVSLAREIIDHLSEINFLGHSKIGGWLEESF